MAEREWTSKDLGQRFSTRLIARLKREGRLVPRRYEKSVTGQVIHWYSNADAQMVEGEAIKSRVAGRKNLGQAFRGPHVEVKRKGAKHCDCGRVAARVEGKAAWCSKCYAHMTRYKDL